MSRWMITLFVAAGSLLQTLIPPWNAFGNLEIPLMYGLLVFIALHANLPESLYGAAVAGLMYDAFSPAPLGVSIPFFIGISMGANWIRNEVFGDHPATYAILGAITTILGVLYYAAVFALTDLRPVPVKLLALKLAGGLISGMVVVPLTALVALQLCRMFTVRSRRRFI